ncbi:hypothetical protein JOF28_001359 [Leucobacter exalbidus]|uniref:Uncharacterized protein n=1 Tax=Leucobacter exalbidus TaxID=662960 RepID=A0A940PSR4_9MICO|nr:hypothetical protein [Leucobacter exalbidus]MBP1326127.1 hypothetical protein [Leucobacter exalbidus]
MADEDVNGTSAIEQTEVVSVDEVISPEVAVEAEEAEASEEIDSPEVVVTEDDATELPVDVDSNDPAPEAEGSTAAPVVPAEEEPVAPELPVAPKSAQQKSAAPSVKVEAPGPVADAITKKCTVTLTMPKTIKVSRENQAFHIGTKGTSCLDRVEITLRRASDNLELDSWNIYGSDSQYQTGRVTKELPSSYWINGNIAGKYVAEVSSRSLNYSWANSNNLSAWSDYPTINIVNKTVDVRAAASAPLKLQREISGVRLTSTVTRFDASNNKMIALPNRQVSLQKKNSAGNWVTKKTVTMNWKGKYSTLIKDSKKGTWRAVLPANSSAFGATSAAKSVVKKSSGKAKTKVSNEYVYNWSGPSYYQGTVKINAGGGYYKAPAGVKVRVQKKTNGAWSTFKTVKTNSAGNVKYAPTKSGSYRFVVKASSTYKSSKSSSKSYY